MASLAASSNTVFSNFNFFTSFQGSPSARIIPCLRAQKQNHAAQKIHMCLSSRKSSHSGRISTAEDASFVGKLPSISRSAGKTTPRSKTIVTAKDDVPEFKGHPPMEHPPEWYWRVFAFIPYIIPLCEGWFHCHSSFFVFAFLPVYMDATYPILLTVARMPRYFMLTYFLTCFIGIVRNNRWPHFVRAHYITAILLELVLQVVGTICEWIPSSIQYGKIVAYGLGGLCAWYVVSILACMVCSVKGMYAEIPFITDAAYMQIPYE